MAIKKVGKQVGGFFSEFWKFAAKGNAIQLAVAVVLGNAFTGVVNALVSDIITPLLSLLTNNINFSAWKYQLRNPLAQADGSTVPAVVINYGHLLQAIINFLVVGLAIFLIFKLLQGVFQRFQKQEAKQPPAPAISTEEKLLTEIRDLLKAQAK